MHLGNVRIISQEKDLSSQDKLLTKPLSTPLPWKVSWAVSSPLPGLPAPESEHCALLGKGARAL